jgi:ABC-type multidrug transport system fused ATPase/permease subunit
VLITAHDAFGYFGKQYGVEVRGLQGTSTTAEAGVRDVQELSRLIAERKIKAIFVESSVPRASIEAVQGGRAGARLAGRHRRPTFFRRDGGRGHARRHLRRHGPAQRGHDRKGAQMTQTQVPIAPAPILANAASGASPISVRDVTVAYEEKPVLWDIDLDVPPASLMAIIGPNGPANPRSSRRSSASSRSQAGSVAVFGSPMANSGGWSATFPSAAAWTGIFPPTCST